MTNNTRANWILASLGTLSLCLSLTLFLSTTVYAGCSAFTFCSDGTHVECSCGGLGTCNSGGGCAVCRCGRVSVLEKCCGSE